MMKGGSGKEKISIALGRVKKKQQQKSPKSHSSHPWILHVHSIQSRTPFIPVKVAQWCLKPKLLYFRGMKLPECSAL